MLNGLARRLAFGCILLLLLKDVLVCTVVLFLNLSQQSLILLLPLLLTFLILLLFAVVLAFHARDLLLLLVDQVGFHLLFKLALDFVRQVDLLLFFVHLSHLLLQVKLHYFLFLRTLR